MNLAVAFVMAAIVVSVFWALCAVAGAADAEAEAMEREQQHERVPEDVSDVR